MPLNLGSRAIAFAMKHRAAQKKALSEPVEALSLDSLDGEELGIDEYSVLDTPDEAELVEEKPERSPEEFVRSYLTSRRIARS